eukprot:Gb_22099 [translate_table: standard]
MYNKYYIQIILHLLTNMIYFTISSTYFITSKKKLNVFNYWIQELFYALSNTMKYFSIISVTNLYIGFHLNHGWELMIDSISKIYGFVHNK